MVTGLSRSARASVTSAIMTNAYLLPVPEAGSLRSRWRQGCFSSGLSPWRVGGCLLPHGPPPCVLTWSSLYVSAILHGGPPQRTHLTVTASLENISKSPEVLGLRTSTRKFAGDTIHPTKVSSQHGRLRVKTGEKEREIRDAEQKLILARLNL